MKVLHAQQECHSKEFYAIKGEMLGGLQNVAQVASRESTETELSCGLLVPRLWRHISLLLAICSILLYGLKQLLYFYFRIF